MYSLHFIIVILEFQISTTHKKINKVVNIIKNNDIPSIPKIFKQFNFSKNCG